MKAVNERRLGIGEDVYRHWDMCIQCRACEAVCPSGVPYGRLIEKTMVQVERRRKVSLLGRFISWLVIGKILPDQNALTGVVGALRLYQRSGLQSALRLSRLLKIMPAKIADLEQSLPTTPDAFFAAEGQTYQAQGQPRASVALLSGCVMPLVHGPHMRAVVRVLNRNGVEVIVPQSQVCCGAIHTHVGDIEGTRELARRNVDAFLALPVDAVITASAGCGTRMKEYGELLGDDAQYAQRARDLSEKVLDVHEFLCDLPIDPPKGTLDCTVTYQDACHLSHTQDVRSQPRALLESIPGIRLTEMSDSTRCCGAGGTYTIHPKGDVPQALERQDEIDRGYRCSRGGYGQPGLPDTAAVRSRTWRRPYRGQVRDRSARRGVPCRKVGWRKGPTHKTAARYRFGLGGGAR